MSVTMIRAPQASIGNFNGPRSVLFEVCAQDGTRRGELHISLGGVEWKQTGAQSGQWCSWDDFIEKMKAG